MELLEREIEQLIIETPNEKLRERGLPVWGKKKKQVHLGSWGRADLICCGDINGEMHVGVFELKKGMITVDAVVQLAQYTTVVREYMSLRFKDRTVYVVPYVIGRDFDHDAGMLFSGIERLGLIKYSCDCEGLHFTWVKKIEWMDLPFKA